MASPPPDQLPSNEHDPPPPEHPAPDQASPQLLAPPGWLKKIASLKKGGTPKKKDVYFVSPDGEEIKSKRLLDRYLKSHPGGPASSEFDWSTGDTPTRRSSRLSLKARPSLDSPEGESGRKRRKKDNEESNVDEDKEPGKLLPAAPPTAAKQEQLMEEVKTEEFKMVEETVEPPSEVNDDDGKEPEPVDKQIESAAGVTAEVDQGDTQVDGDKESEGQVPVEGKLVGEQSEVKQLDAEACADQDGGKDQKDELDMRDGKVCFLEEQTEQKEVSDKISTGCQQLSEAQNSSRPVDVSI